jgi:hypothetical protein
MFNHFAHTSVSSSTGPVVSPPPALFNRVNAYADSEPSAGQGLNRY